MKVLVTGNPRSGTLSLSLTLRKAGLDVGHERMGKDGTVSCFFFKQVEYYPREGGTENRHLTDGKDDSFDEAEFDFAYHLVRNPLKCIPSMQKIVNRRHRQWIRDIGICEWEPKTQSNIEWCALAWYHTNLYIEKNLNFPRLRVETLLKDWPTELCPRPAEIKHSHKSSGFRKAAPITPAQLTEISGAALSKSILDMARRYGYAKSDLQ